VKRFIVLLVFVAGGLAAAALAVPTNAATVNGTVITQNQLNFDVTAIAGSLKYQCFLNAEQFIATNGETSLSPVVGVGKAVQGGPYPTATTAFAAEYLDTEIEHQLLYRVAAQRHINVDAHDLATARSDMKEQMSALFEEVTSDQAQEQVCGVTTLPSASAVLSSMPKSFIDASVRFDATSIVLEESLAGVGQSAADLVNYFDAHRSMFDTACFTVAQYTTSSAAEAAAASVTPSTPFSKVAAEVAGGGPQGCDILYGVTSQLPAGTNLQDLPVNKVSAPIEDDGSYLLVQITSRTPTPFASAKTAVQSAVLSAGAALAPAVIEATERQSSISIDPRYGQWKSDDGQILPPTTPLVADVLNAKVNSPAAATSPTSTTPSTGQSG
jgi:hypothetical protein